MAVHYIYTLNILITLPSLLTYWASWLGVSQILSVIWLSKTIDTVEIVVGKVESEKCAHRNAPGGVRGE